MKRTLTFIFLAGLFSAFHLNAQTANPGYIDGVIYVKLYDTTTAQLSYSSPSPALAQIIADYSITNIEKPFTLPDIPVQQIYKVSFSNYAAANDLMTDCYTLPGMEYCELAPMIALDYQPNDYNATTLWHLQRIHAPAAWNTTTGSSSIKIAIVDNAVNYNHVDLTGNAWTNPGEIPGNNIDDDLNGYIDDVHGYDVTDRDNNPLPPPGTLNTSPFIHGTHCAGIASATTNNGIGISSIAFRAKIISVKCAPDTGTGERLRNAYEGLDYAIAAGADVVSMSFGGPGNSLTWQVLVNAATIRNIVLVASAGNSNTNTPFYPAACNNVIAVGATDQNDVRASFSNYGSWVDVMAPGVSIYSTLPQNGNTYGTLSGTSMSCPLTAGLAGLVLALNPNYTQAQVENFIKAGCQDIDALNPNYIGQIGTGRIDANLTMAVITGMHEAVNPEVFSVYPNPSNGAVFLQTNMIMEAPLQMEVYDVSGKLVGNEVLPAANADGRIDLRLNEKLSPGQYSLIFRCNKELIETEKLIIEKR